MFINSIIHAGESADAVLVFVLHTYLFPYYGIIYNELIFRKIPIHSFFLLFIWHWFHFACHKAVCLLEGFAPRTDFLIVLSLKDYSGFVILTRHFFYSIVHWNIIFPIAICFEINCEYSCLEFKSLLNSNCYSNRLALFAERKHSVPIASEKVRRNKFAIFDKIIW